MTLVASSHPNKAHKFFSSKLYKIRVQFFRTQPLYFLVQNIGPFTTRTCTLDSSRAPQSDPHLIEQLILSGKTEPRTEISDHGTQRSSSRTEGEKNPGMLESGLKKPLGTGSVTAVTGLIGPARFRIRAVRNRAKFKF